METLTAIIRAKPGHEDTVAAELAKVGAFAAEHEPDTIGFFVAQDPDDPCRFTTYERFTDAAARDRHNNGAGSQGFFAAAGHLLDGEVTIVTAREIWPR
ncbi:putative quinol monooxygenase [Marimonas sp. MJW-29]|uniref:Quinol monooxygenase n=1 Tax=Sulfitobacter sediminis TaxID=3234186 RepID=A0ABV3RIG9_9RHOB